MILKSDIHKQLPGDVSNVLASGLKYAKDILSITNGVNTPPVNFLTVRLDNR